MKTQNTSSRKFNKGDELFAVWYSCDYNSDSCVARFVLVPLRLTSWGKKQGTALRLDLPESPNAKYRFYVGSTCAQVSERIEVPKGGYPWKTLDSLPGVVATVEEVEEYAKKWGPRLSEETRVRHLEMEREWLSKYERNPDSIRCGAVQRSKEKIAKYENLSPSFEVVVLPRA